MNKKISNFDLGKNWVNEIISYERKMYKTKYGDGFFK